MGKLSTPWFSLCYWTSRLLTDLELEKTDWDGGICRLKVPELLLTFLQLSSSISFFISTSCDRYWTTLEWLIRALWIGSLSWTEGPLLPPWISRLYQSPCHVSTSHRNPHFVLANRKWNASRLLFWDFTGRKRSSSNACHGRNWLFPNTKYSFPLFKIHIFRNKCIPTAGVSKEKSIWCIVWNCLS